jgi:NDP-sugar pyrophosphorylase family protein
MIDQCLILAGGLGTRLLPVTAQIPKTLVAVAGRPFAWYQLRWLAKQGIRKVVYLIAHHGQQIRDYVGDGAAWGLDVSYVEEGPELLGTAGALRLAVDEGAFARPAFVTYGDSFLQPDLAAASTSFAQFGQPFLMTVFRNSGQWDTSNCLFQDGRLLVYDKRREDPRAPQMQHIDYGWLVIDPQIVRELVPANVKFDLADLCHTLSRTGRLAGIEVPVRFYEVGSHRGLQEFSAFVQHHTELFQ